MSILVVGASGATGRYLVQHLLERGQKVRIIVRSADYLAPDVAGHEDLSIVEASLPALSDTQLARYVNDCDALASCLGHNMTFKGLFGPPRRLVTEATRRLCEAAKNNERSGPVRFILMNTTGNRNRDLNEPISLKERLVIGLLRVFLPPHADNEQAADFLRTQFGQSDKKIQWCAVRPDTLVDSDAVTEYEVHRSPIRSAIFDAGSTSRINVAHFMAELITNDETWHKWKGQMPVIYNK